MHDEDLIDYIQEPDDVLCTDDGLYAPSSVLRSVRNLDIRRKIETLLEQKKLEKELYQLD